MDSRERHESRARREKERTYEEVLESDLVRVANIISSRAVIEGKSNDDGTLKLKGRPGVHANRDYEIDLGRRDCALYLNKDIFSQGLVGPQKTLSFIDASWI